jgi:hypothetical protein
MTEIVLAIRGRHVSSFLPAVIGCESLALEMQMAGEAVSGQWRPGAKLPSQAETHEDSNGR